MKLLAPAKINLALEIEGRRADGFHELRTLMVPIDFCDELELDFANHGLIFNATGCDFPAEGNLAFKAARLFLERTSQDSGIRVDLVKHIPAGAGLGGGGWRHRASAAGLVQ